MNARVANNEPAKVWPGLRYEPMKVKIAMHTSHTNDAVVELKMDDPQFPIVSVPYNSKSLKSRASPQEVLGKPPKANLLCYRSC